MTKKDLKESRILVTGGAGFIGSRLIENLLAQGAQVSAFIRYTSRAEMGLLQYLPKQLLVHLRVIRGDLRDFDAVDQAMRDADLVFHLGALISIPYSYIHPVETVETNILGTLNILQACRRYDCKLVHTSSSEVYGTAQYVPIDERHPLQGQSPYSASKIGSDKLVESYYRSYGVQAITVRPFNTYGPGQSSRAVIPTIITQALLQDTIYLGNLDTWRDFTYLDDTVNGFLKAVQAEGVIGETFNLGTGEEISIRDLAEKIISLVGRPVKVELDSARMRPEKSEVMRLLSDNRKARERLSWQPKVPIDEGLSVTIQWIKEHLDLYDPGRYGI